MRELLSKNIRDAQDPEKYGKKLGFYRNMGVEVYKKWTPLSGDLTSKLIWHHLGLRQVAPSRRSLSRMINVTYMLELSHGSLFIATGVEGIKRLFQGDTITGLLMIAANVPVNFYPVFLQRYNRLRLFHALGKRIDLEERG